GMDADRLIDRTMIEARAAAYAAQHVLELGAKHIRAAVVEDDDVIFQRTVGIIGAPGTGREGRVVRQVLAGGRGGQHAQNGRRIFERGHDLLEPGDDAMGRGERLGTAWVRSPLPSLVTMIEVPVSATRKLAPVMPTSASRYFWRSTWRASSTRVGISVRSRLGSRCVCALRKSASIWSRVRWTAGAM